MSIRLRPAAETASANGIILPTSTDVPMAGLARMLATARYEIDRHLNGSGTCTLCGNSWPCTTACLAEFTLGAF